MSIRTRGYPHLRLVFVRDESRSTKASIAFPAGSARARKRRGPLVPKASGKQKVRLTICRSPKARPLPLMHGKQDLDGQGRVEITGRLDNSIPIVLGDAPPTPPFLDPLFGNRNGVREFSSAGPQIEDFGHGGNLQHSELIQRDKLSRQHTTSCPVTPELNPGTISPMSRSNSPTKFKAQFCERLKAARIAAGLTQEEVAKALDLIPNTYNKYENRSFLPNHLLEDACKLLNVEIDYLFTGKRSHKNYREVG